MPDDKVGYKNPPKKSQFRKGQSGNRKGRPKGSLNMKNILTNELSQEITILENGTPKKISRAEAITKKAMEKGLKGDTRMMMYWIDQIYKLAEKEKPYVDPNRPTPTLEDAQALYREMIKSS